MRHIPARLRRLVLRRSGERCEFCQLSQAGQEATFHIYHITPVTADGETLPTISRWLACRVRFVKAHGRPPSTRKPRLKFRYSIRAGMFGQRHFQWDDVRLVGLTATGRATIETLALNRPLILAIRREEAALGRHPF